MKQIRGEIQEKERNFAIQQNEIYKPLLQKKTLRHERNQSQRF